MYEKEFEAAKLAVIRAGNYLLERKGFYVDSFEGKDIKLSSDKKSEKILMDELGSFGYSILAEEQGFVNRETELCWVIDPLDGTMNYSKGMDDLSCVSVALWKKDEPVLGVINRFRVDEVFSGMIGQGAWLNDSPMVTSEVKDVKDAVLATGFPVKRAYDSGSLGNFISNVQRFKKIRMLGAAALMGSFVACGRIDAYMEEDIMLWDIAAAVALVKAAGGECFVEKHEDNKCLCMLFANNTLKASYEMVGKNESI